MNQIPITRRIGGHTSRGRFIVFLLLTTLVLAGALAYQAMDSVASHRATANSVLEDYAAFAAEQYAARVSQELTYYGVQPPLRRFLYLHGALGQETVPTRSSLLQDADRTLSQALDLVRYLFRFDPKTGAVTAARDEEQTPPEWLGDALSAHVRASGNTSEASGAGSGSLMIVDAEDGVRVFVYVMSAYDTSDTTGYGFEVDSEEFTRYFRAAFQRSPLLPPTLTGGVSYDSLLSVRVIRENGSEFLTLAGGVSGVRDGEYPLPVIKPLTAGIADLKVAVALDPAAAEILVTGALPKSRLPFIVGFFLLTVGLIAGILLQLRRERELDRLRTEFVSNVSHELRTPLAQIRMFAETLLLGRVRSQAEHVRSLAIIDKESRRLTHLVENVLLFSRSERRAVRLELETVDMAELLNEIMESFRPLAEAQQTSLSLDTEPIVLQADRGAVKQIVLNLLDNAVKYGPAGQHVRVRCGLQDGWTQITVEDEGPGVPAADRSRIWGRFERLERERQSSIAGAGIGLAVVHELAQMHDGRCAVETRDRGGARFSIEIPGGHLRSNTEASDQGRKVSQMDAVSKSAG